MLQSGQNVSHWTRLIVSPVCPLQAIGLSPSFILSRRHLRSLGETQYPPSLPCPFTQLLLICSLRLTLRGQQDAMFDLSALGAVCSAHLRCPASLRVSEIGAKAFPPLPADWFQWGRPAGHDVG